MVDNSFWKKANRAWKIVPQAPKVVNPPPPKKDEGEIDFFSAEPQFDPSMLKPIAPDNNADATVPEPKVIVKEAGEPIVNNPQPQVVNIQPVKIAPIKPKYVVDMKKFDAFMAENTFKSYVKCCELLLSSGLPEDIIEKLITLADKMQILDSSLEKFPAEEEGSQRFNEFYIPECLDTIIKYIEFVNTGVDESIIYNTRKDMMEAINTLIGAINSRTKEIFDFATMQLRAQAQALESLMGQDGFVNPAFKLPNTDDSAK